jgi:hypothetical protein
MEREKVKSLRMLHMPKVYRTFLMVRTFWYGVVNMKKLIGILAQDLLSQPGGSDLAATSRSQPLQ